MFTFLSFSFLLLLLLLFFAQQTLLQVRRGVDHDMLREILEVSDADNLVYWAIMTILRPFLDVRFMNTFALNSGDFANAVRDYLGPSLTAEKLSALKCKIFSIVTRRLLLANGPGFPDGWYTMSVTAIKEAAAQAIEVGGVVFGRC